MHPPLIYDTCDEFPSWRSKHVRARGSHSLNHNVKCTCRPYPYRKLKGHSRTNSGDSDIDLSVYTKIRTSKSRWC
jgi:hypothetical protein